MSPLTACPICREPLGSTPTWGDEFYITCPRCGTYRAAWMFAKSEAEDRDFYDAERWALSRVLRNYFDEHGAPLDRTIHRRIIPELIAAQPPPRTFTAQIHDFLLRIASRTSFYGEATVLEPLITWAGRLGLPKAKHFVQLLEGAGELGYLRVVARPGQGDSAPVSLMLTPSGWTEVERLRSTDRGNAKAFMAAPKLKELRSEDQLQLDFEAHCERGVGLALLFFDIDHFKALNTRLTESVVDDVVLRPIQHFLLREVEGRGFVYSVGGDEFIILLQNISPAEALAFGHRLCQNVRRWQFPTPLSGIVTLTVSVGVATSPADGLSLAEVRQAANAAENRAKMLGRDQVCGVDAP